MTFIFHIVVFIAKIYMQSGFFSATPVIKVTTLIYNDPFLRMCWNPQNFNHLLCQATSPLRVRAYGAFLDFAMIRASALKSSFSYIYTFSYTPLVKTIFISMCIHIAAIVIITDIFKRFTVQITCINITCDNL